jgi:hypothetical protein
VHTKAAQEIMSEKRGRDRVELQRRRAQQRARDEMMYRRSSFGAMRKFHPTNGRNNFDKHASDESVREALAAQGVEMPSAGGVKALLRAEKLLRLDPLTQVGYAMPESFRPS